MSLPETVRSVRLRLELIAPDAGRAMLAGHRAPSWHPDYPRREDLDAAAMIPAQGSPWAARQIVRAFDGLVVGTIGFFGAPDAADDGVPEVEIGVGLVPDARGHGAAAEAVRALLGETDRRGVRVRARTRPENAAGISLLARSGFTVLRGGDEDGNLVMARPLPAEPGADAG